MHSKIIAIDPGKSGGIAYRDIEGIVRAVKMPDGMTAQADALCGLRVEVGPHTEAAMEKVGFHVQGNSAGSSAKFARHCGHLEAMLYCQGTPCKQVAPGVWMRSIGTMPKDKCARKRAIKEEMQRRHPHLKVTLATADALGILGWAEKMEQGK